MTGFRIFLAIAIVTAGTLLAFIFFKDELIKRAQPPQATIVTPQPAPQAASDSKPATLVDDVAPVFEAVRVSGNCLATLAGRATPGALVTVRAEQRELGRVTAGVNGEWALVPDLPLEKGSRELSLHAERAGAKPIDSESVVVVDVPDCGTGQPLVGEQAVAVIASNTATARLLQPLQAAAAIDATSTLTLDTVDFDKAGSFTVSGMAPSRTEVQVYMNNKPIGVVTTSQNGRWLMTAREQISPGIYTLRAVPVGDKGKIIAKADLVQERAARAAKAEGKAKISTAASTGGRIVVQKGQTLWSIAEQAYGDGSKYKLIVAANSQVLADGAQVKAGQVLVLPKAAPKKAATKKPAPKATGPAAAPKVSP